MRRINLIVIHCSASPNGVYVSSAQIDAWHAARGFHREPAAVGRFNRALAHIGYHWVITADGRPNTGRHTDEIGAHALNFNANSIGICMTGTDRFFLRQWDALAQLICDLAYLWQADCLPKKDQIAYPFRPALAIMQLAKMGITIVGHRDRSPDKNGDGKITSIDWLKTCPGFDVAGWLKTEMYPTWQSLLDGEESILHPSPLVRTGQVAA